MINADLLAERAPHAISLATRLFTGTATFDDGSAHVGGEIVRSKPTMSGDQLPISVSAQPGSAVDHAEEGLPLIKHFRCL
jgi:hypothetical protein